MDYNPEDLDQLQPLTTTQYDKCRETAQARIRKRIGTKPEYKDFKVHYGGRWWQRLFIASNVLNGLALIIFTAALVMSSMNIITHMGIVAETGYQNLTGDKTLSGLIITETNYVAINQIAAIFLAESAMIVFIVKFALDQRRWFHWRRLAFALMALAAAIFVIYSNINSQMEPFESILPPVFTIGVGIFFEQIIVDALKERREIMTRLQAALEKWQAESQDITQHPDYRPALYQEVWQKLVSLKANRGFVDYPSDFKRAAVERELERDLWAFDQMPFQLRSRQRSRDSRESHVKRGGTIQNEGKSERLRKLFSNQPETIEIARLDPHVIAEQADVSLGLVYKIRKEFEGQFSQNGHGTYTDEEA